MLKVPHTRGKSMKTISRVSYVVLIGGCLFISSQSPAVAVGLKRDQPWLRDLFYWDNRIVAHAGEFFFEVDRARACDRTPRTFEYGFSPAVGYSNVTGRGSGDGSQYPGYVWPPSFKSKIEFKTVLKPATTLLISPLESSLPSPPGPAMLKRIFCSMRERFSIAISQSKR